MLVDIMNRSEKIMSSSNIYQTTFILLTIYNIRKLLPFVNAFIVEDWKFCLQKDPGCDIRRRIDVSMSWW